MTDHHKQDSPQDRLDQLRALLGLVDLAVPDREPSGPIPDSEDLAALLDNSLDATRRAQVISHLLVNDDLYEDWLLLTEHADLLPDARPQTAAEVTTATAPAGAENPWWLRLGSWRPTMAAAAVIALVVGIAYNPATDPVDKLYAEYGSGLHQTLAALPDVTSRSPSRPWETWQLALASGLDEGLDTLGHERNLYDIDRERLHDASVRYRGLRNTQLDEVRDTGRLALLGVLVCAQQNEAAAESVIRELSPRWSSVSAGAPVSAPELDPGDALESACMAGEWALQSLR
ncbi:MAG: hypothetical protein LAT61_12715 [Alcanivorax sp.]|nr:hypothetical protein [Alcanivorax sp.]